MRRVMLVVAIAILVVFGLTHVSQIQAMYAAATHSALHGSAPLSLPFGLGGSMSGTPTPVIAPPPPAAVIQDYANRVIALTNHYRQQNGCSALTPNPILMGTAQAHSEDMAIHDFVGHNSSDGTTAWDRMLKAGYRYSIVAENVAWGQPTPEQAVNDWFNETPPNDLHRQNILNCKLQDIGVGYYYLKDDPGNITAHYYWTEDFGTPWGA
jgi:uncharacterized protein YkwD